MKYLIWLSSDCANLRELVDALNASDNDIGLLLIQDGVFMADKGCSESEELLSFKLPFYACEAHVEERGIKDRLIDGVELVDYNKIINIIMEQYDKIISL
jgi:sulfur relay protein TusB/DsrH